jgi:glycosyltransferase involved in cell wall biosynthesis
MRILHVMLSKVNGGAETYACDVIAKLHEAGFDQCVVMYEDAPRFAGLKALEVRMAPSPLSVPLAPVQRFMLRGLIAREKPDIVQTWMRRGASLVGQGAQPVIGWFQGYNDPRYFKSCDLLVGVTRDVVAHMVKNGVPPERTRYIPTFPVIEPAPPVDRASLSTPADAPLLLLLSRMHERKGIDTFLQAFAGLPECYAWLAGDGPLQAQMEKLAKDLGVWERVRFLGWRTDRSALLGAADICVLPSRYESFGTVILEAWASRTPLVACAAQGPAAHIADGVNGLLAPVDDHAALRSAIQRVVADEALQKSLAANGFETYHRDFTPEAVAAQWIGFYESVTRNAPQNRDGFAVTV